MVASEPICVRRQDQFKADEIVVTLSAGAMGLHGTKQEIHNRVRLTHTTSVSVLTCGTRSMLQSNSQDDNLVLLPLNLR